MVFIKTYNLLDVCYGYKDNLEVFFMLFSILLFYFFEVFSDMIINKMENIALNIVFNTSVVVFAFSFIVVAISYILKVNYTNLFVVFCSLFAT